MIYHSKSSRYQLVKLSSRKSLLACERREQSCCCEGDACEKANVLGWVSDQGLFASQVFLCSEGYRLFFFPVCHHVSANVDKNVMLACGLHQVDSKMIYLKKFRHGPFAARGAGGHWQSQLSESYEVARAETSPKNTQTRNSPTQLGQDCLYLDRVWWMTQSVI